MVWILVGGMVQGQRAPVAQERSEFEVTEDAGVLILPLSREGLGEGDLTFDLTVRSITARVGKDFRPLPSEIRMDAGVDEIELPLELIDNTSVDGDRWLELEWGDPEGRSSTVTVWIRDDERALAFDPSFGTQDQRFVPLAFGSEGMIYAGHQGNLVRLDSDGRLDPSFKLEGFQVEPRQDAFQDIALVRVDPSGDLFVGVNYEFYGPQAPVMYSWLQRYRADGTPVEGYGRTRLRTGYLIDMLLEPEGSVVYAGIQENFQTGSVTVRMGRVRPDGSVDSEFGSNRVFTGHDGEIRVLGRQSDGGILVAGQFNEFNSMDAASLVRLDPFGSLDSNFESILQEGSHVGDLVVLPDDRILIAGNLVIADGDRRHLLRLDPKGGIDWEFEGAEFTMGGTISKLVADYERNWLYGFGNFQRVDDQARDGLFRLELSTGRLDDFVLPLNGRGGSGGRVISVQPSGNLVTSRGRIITDQVDRQRARFLETRYQTTETSEEPLSIEIERQGSSQRALTVPLEVSSSGDEGIEFESLPAQLEFPVGETRLVLPLQPVDNGNLNGPMQIKLSLLDTEGGLMKRFSPQAEIVIVDNEIPNRIDPAFAVRKALTIDTFKRLSDGRIVVATPINENPLQVLRSDGSLDGGFSAPNLFPSAARITALVENREGWVLAGGWADDIRGARRPMISRFDPMTGRPDESFVAPRLLVSRQGYGQVTAILTQQVDQEEMIVLGGSIRSGGRRDGLIRLRKDGTLDPDFGDGVGVSRISGGLEIWVLRSFSDGRLLVGGIFDTIDGLPSPGIAILGSDGRLDESFQSPFKQNDWIQSAALDNEDRVLVAVRYNWREHVVLRLLQDGSIDETFEPVKLEADVRSIAIDSADRVYLFGHFDTVAGAAYPRVARLLANGEPDSTFWPTRSSSARVQKGEILPDGTILVGMDGLIFDEQQVNGLFRFDPSADAARTSVVFDLNSTNRSIHEGSDDVPSEFRLVRLGASTSAQPVSFRLAVEGAIPGVDFELDGRSIGFEPLAIESVFGVSALDDGLVESVESVRFEITGVPTLPRQSSATLSIHDNEEASIVDYGFPTGKGPNSTPRVLLELPDGKMLIGGQFDQFNGGAVPPLVRIHPDGSLDETFHLEGDFSGRVHALLWWNDSLLIGGLFDYPMVDGSNRHNLVRVGLDGEKIDVTDTFPDTDQAVQVIELASDGSIFVGGEFRRVGDQRRNSIARILPDGTVDENFAGLGAVFYGLNAVEVLKDGRVIIGGRHVTIGRDDRGALLRLNEDGTIDEDFRPAFRGTVYDILQLEDRTTLIGGNFWSIGGAYGSGLVKIDEDGRRDPTFELELHSGEVRRIRQDGNRIVLGGGFQTEENHPATTLAWITASGEVVKELPGAGASGSLWPVDFVIGIDGHPVLASNPTRIGGVETGHLLRLKTDGTSQTTLNLSQSIGVLVEPNGVLEVPVHRFGDLTRSSRVHVQVASESAEATGNVKLLDEVVEFARLDRLKQVRLEVVDDDLAEADGHFTLQLTEADANTAIGVDSVEVRVIDNDREGSLMSEFRPEIQRDDYYGYEFFSLGRRRLSVVGSFGGANVWDLEVQRDGRILIAGNFCRVNDIEIEGLARLLPDGALDDSYWPGLSDSAVEQMALQSDDRLVYVNQGTGEHRLLRLNADGKPDLSFHSLPVEGGGYIQGLLVLPDDRIVIWGELGSWSHLGSDRLAVLLPDGEVDLSFDSGEGFNRAVRSVHFQSPDYLVVAGEFSSYNRHTARGLVRIQTSGEVEGGFAPLGGPNRNVDRLNVLGNGWMQIAGSFTQVDGHLQRDQAMLSKDGSLLMQESMLPFFTHALPLTNGDSYTVNERSTPERRWEQVTRRGRLGAVDPQFDVGSGLVGSVRALALAPGGDLLIAGNLQQFNGVPVSSVIRVRGRLEMWISSISRTEQGQTRVDVVVQSGREYHLEHSRDLIHWERRDSQIADTSELSFWDDSSAAEGFYRVRQE